jgi:hypothetical protein
MVLFYCEMGEGIRTLHVLGLAISIYTAEFWTAEQLQTLDEVLQLAGNPNKLDIPTFSRSVGQSGVTTAWQRQLDASVTYKYDGYEDDRDAFVNMFGPIDKGGTETVIISGDDTYVIDQGVAKGIIRGKDFQQAFFSMWFGEQAVSPDLKTGLLGIDPSNAWLKINGPCIELDLYQMNK